MFISKHIRVYKGMFSNRKRGVLVINIELVDNDYIPDHSLASDSL